MFELIGLIFGGASRLAQHFLDLRDKAAERDHEYRMYEQQVALADKKYASDASMRQMDAAAAETAGDISLLVTALNDQSTQAKAAGGFVLSLSASVRPVVSYWLMLLYTCAKAASLYITLQSGAPLAEAVRAAYTEYDGTLMASIVSFWFADRALRKNK